MNICHEITNARNPHGRHLGQPLFVRLDIGQEYGADDAFDQAQQIMPVLYLKAGSQKDVVESHVKYAHHLKSCGINQCVIAADEDGALQRSLSPRFSPQSLDERIKPLTQIFSKLQEIMEEVWVLLTVEELAPGGIDATDGVAIANALAKMGLKTIIATAGTKDFMPLYDRRTTQKKGAEEFYSNEPGLACSLWLINNTNLTVWCSAFLDDDEKALKLAQTIGLSGLIKKEKYDKI